jgi:hypothetical protein
MQQEGAKTGRFGDFSDGVRASSLVLNPKSFPSFLLPVQSPIWLYFEDTR